MTRSTPLQRCAASAARLLRVLLLCVPAACSTVHQTANGVDWQLGYVRSIKPGSAIRDPQVRPCVAALRPEEVAAQTFVVVTLHHGRATEYRTVPLPDDFRPVAGARVWINMASCRDALRAVDTD